MAAPNTETRRPNQKRDAAVEASLPPQPESTDKTHPFNKIDPGKSKGRKLSTRGLELLVALSGKRISITDIKITEKIPQDGGTFADVMMATLFRASHCGQGENRVAVKKLRFFGDMTEEKFHSGFVNELRLLDKLSHPNIVKIIGFVEDMEHRIAWLVFPWETNGNLRKFLRSGNWEIPERVSLIEDVALGLEYLHTLRTPICHGDLKSLNILVNRSNCAVITDFGSARIVKPGVASARHPAASASHTPSKSNENAEFQITLSNNTLTFTGPACSIRWAPPEHFRGDPLGLASDIWALGWIAWETITDHYPFEELDSETHVLMRVLGGQLPMIYDHHQLSEIGLLCSMMQRCWKQDPVERPPVTECLKTMKLMPKAIPSRENGNKPKERSAILLMQTGEIHRSKGRGEEASKIFEQGLTIARSTGDQVTVADLLIRLADNHRAQGRNVKAEGVYTEALAVCESIGYDRGRADAIIGLGRIQLAGSHHVKAVAPFTEAVAVCKNIGYTDGTAYALILLGHVQKLQSQCAEAEASFAEALDICNSNGFDHGRARSLDGLGDVQKLLSKYAEAEVSYTKVLDIYKSIGDDKGRANAWNDLGDVQTVQSKDAEAERSCAEALAICESIGYDQGRANALNGLGDILRQRSKYIEAEAAYVEAVAVCKSTRDDQGRANALSGLGSVRRQQCKYVEAEASYVEALAIYKNLGDNKGQANAFNWLGNVLGQQRKYIEAESSYTEAVAMYTSIGNDQGRANALNRLGEVQLEQSKCIEAETSYVEALAICKSIGDERGRANALNGLGDVRQHQVKHVEAEESYVEALAIYKRIGDDQGRVNSSLELARIMIHRAQLAEAKALVEDSTSISERIDYAWGMDTSDELLTEILEAERSCNSSLLPSYLPTSTRAEDSG
ncbi:hypothetical protein M407DRAFT_34180 [Tulasnella calospora MUT 4182]|uniref:Protein kinase domain-containing protein n=1 Tax=Tulasnella calospora MUT 4182 TaxID=1051891 RepID=A0A0C3L369_9AGAM|nr:hypothetical protein M407DRAFT_34180 [Tulasnella calospora MUT 4182]